MEHIEEDKIKYAEFYLKNRELIKKILIFSLFFIDLVIIAGLALRFLVYNRTTLLQLKTENYLAYDYVPYDQIQRRLSPQALRIRQVQSVRVAPNQYDLVAEIYNPNQEWLAKTVKYAFTFDGNRLTEQTSYILPGSSSFVMRFSLETGTPLPTSKLDITDVDWLRIRDNERQSILANITVDPPTFRNSSDGFQISSKLNNNTAYSFWELGLAAIVTGASDIVGINYVTLEQVRSGSSRDLIVSWPQPLTSPQQVSLIPLVNVYDDSVYMPISSFGQPGDPSGIELQGR